MCRWVCAQTSVLPPRTMAVVETVGATLSRVIDTVSMEWQTEEGAMQRVTRLADVDAAIARDALVWTCGEPRDVDMHMGVHVPTVLRPTFRAAACSVLMFTERLPALLKSGDIDTYERCFLHARRHATALAEVARTMAHTNPTYRVALACGPGACMLGTLRAMKCLMDMAWVVYVMYNSTTNLAVFRCMEYISARCGYMIENLKTVRAPCLRKATYALAADVCRSLVALALVMYPMDQAQRVVSMVHQNIALWSLPPLVSKTVLELVAHRPAYSPDRIPDEPPPAIIEIPPTPLGLSMDDLVSPERFAAALARGRPLSAAVATPTPTPIPL